MYGTCYVFNSGLNGTNFEVDTLQVSYPGPENGEKKLFTTSSYKDI